MVYVGCVGADSYADQLSAANKKEGLSTEYLVDNEHPTGRCGVVITGHDRSMCTDLAAANHYKLSHLTSPKIWELVQKAKLFYVGGYHLTVCVEAIKKLGEEAATAPGKLMILSLSAPFIPEFFKSQLDEVLPYCDYIIGNETEAQAYAKSHNLPQDSIHAIAKALASGESKSGRPKTAIVTQGTDPTIVAVQQGSAVETIGVSDPSDNTTADCGHQWSRRRIRGRLPGRIGGGKAVEDGGGHGPLASKGEHTGAGTCISVSEEDLRSRRERLWMPTDGMSYEKSYHG